jgi:hypothetical protein
MVIVTPAASVAQTPADIVIHAADASEIRGTWQKVTDGGAASGARLWQPNGNVPKVTQASAAPQHFFDLQFRAESGRAYRLWVRSKADGNHYVNDSVYVQFSGTVNSSGAPVYRIGTTGATTVVREDCSGCAFSGWGWQDNEYGNVALGPEIRFADSGLQTMRIQAREDGISIDQVVLSSATWFTSAPGARDNDTTILPKTVEPPPSPGTSMAFTARRYVDGYFDGLAAVDLNGDARPDIAGVYTGGLEVYSAMNDGGRAFHNGHAEESWTSLHFVPRVAAADFNRDGKADLLELDEFWNLVAVFRGDGAGGFTAPVTTRFPERVKDLAVADFTSDGVLDIVVVEPDTGNAVVHEGNGLGGFSFVSFAFACNTPTEVVAGDFNGDRRQDAAVRCPGDRTVRVLYADGTGRFSGESNVINVDAVALGSADLDGNGYSDLVIGWGPNLASIFHGSAVGFTGGSHQTSDMPGARIVERGITFGDMNGDGRLDLVVTHRNSSDIDMLSTFAVMPNTGNRTYGDPEDFATAFFGLPVVVADLDADGRPDVISPESNWGFSIYWNDPGEGNRTPVASAGPDATVMDAEQASFRLDARATTDADGHVLNYEWLSSDGARLWGPTPLAFQYGGYLPGTYTFRLTVDDLQGGISTDTVTITIERPGPEGNRPPVADAGVSLNGVWPYEMQFQDWPDPYTSMFSQSTDPDGDTLTHEWRNAAGELISTDQWWDTLTAPALPPGSHTLTLTVRDGRGGESSDTVSVTVQNYEEIVIGIGYKENAVGPKWEEAEEPEGSSSNLVVRDVEAGAPKVNAPLASPMSYVQFGFVADPTLEYKLWIRLKAKNDYWGNDSVWVQFNGSVDASGEPVFRIGTTSGLSVNLEECAKCGLSRWGWRDDIWGVAGGMSSTYLRFPAGGIQSMRIQTREDGVSIDNVVLSARKYKTTRPGAVKNDTTKLNHSALYGN